MRAALLEAVGRLTLIDAPRPEIRQPGDVLVRVRAVGVCRSEVHAFQGTHPFRKPPSILGHEAAGDVAAVGAGVTAFQVCDRVVIDPQWTCGVCDYCRQGDINLCPSKKVLGTPAWPGALGEYVVVPQETLFPLPPNLSYAQGRLVEPLTVGVHVARRAGVKAGESVAILGTGAIGWLLSGVCAALGAGPIIAADIRQHCLDAARERLGATHDFRLPDPGFAEQVKRLTGGQGVDAVFVTGDEPALVNLGIEIARRRGRIVLVALMMEASLQFPAYPAINKELSIIGSTMSNHDDVRTALELAASGRVDVEGILTHRLPISAAQRGFELAHTKEDGAIKVMLTFDA